MVVRGEWEDQGPQVSPILQTKQGLSWWIYLALQPSKDKKIGATFFCPFLFELLFLTNPSDDMGFVLFRACYRRVLHLN